eukprot:14371362-Alexandrium_andersonii.AAC.1
MDRPRASSRRSSWPRLSPSAVSRSSSSGPRTPPMRTPSRTSRVVLSYLPRASTSRSRARPSSRSSAS